MQVPRSLRSNALAIAVLALFAHSGCFHPLADPATYYLSAPLVPIGGSLGSGRVELLLSEREHSVYFAIEGLAAGADYHVLVDGELFTTLSTDAGGRTDKHTPITSPGFDPRGRRVVVIDPGGYEVLELADRTHPDFREAEVAPLAAFAPGAGSIQTTTIAGMQTLVARVAGVEPGVYDVVVDGTPRATIDAAAGETEACLEAIDFDPRVAAIELARDGVGYFAGSGRASIEGIDWCQVGRAEQSLVATGPGTARAILHTRVDCGRRFEVMVANLPMGDYDLYVGDVLRATISVGEDENGATAGWASFANSERAALPLDFDPIGQSLEVRQGGVSYFTLSVFAP